MGQFVLLILNDTLDITIEAMKLFVDAVFETVFSLVCNFITTYGIYSILGLIFKSVNNPTYLFPNLMA